MTAGDRSSKNLSSELLPVGLLWQLGWPHAAGLFWSRIKAIGVPGDDVASDFWSWEKERCKQACRTLTDLLFTAGHGLEALSALMLAADPTEPQTFEIVLPQLAFAIEHLWDRPTAKSTRHHVLQRLGVWWRAARGDFTDNDSSMFWIVRTRGVRKRRPFGGFAAGACGERRWTGRRAKGGTGHRRHAEGQSNKTERLRDEFKDSVDARCRCGLPQISAQCAQN